MEANKIQVVDEQGNEIEFEVLFTFNNEELGNQYVLYFDPESEDQNVFASIYDDEGKLFPVESPEEWEMIEEVFQSFMAEDEDNEDEEDSGKGECCGGDEKGCCCSDDCDCQN